MRLRLDDKHDIDDEGRVYSVTRHVRFKDMRGRWHWRLLPGRELAQQIDDAGYPIVTLSNKRHRVHRLVAKVFVPNPGGLPVVNHKDGNPANCRAGNLEWCTQSANLIHAFETGLAKPKAKITQSQIDSALAMMRQGVSQTEAARRVGMSQPHLSAICRGLYEPKYATRAP